MQKRLALHSCSVASLPQTLRSYSQSLCSLGLCALHLHSQLLCSFRLYGLYTSILSRFTPLSFALASCSLRSHLHSRSLRFLWHSRLWYSPLLRSLGFVLRILSRFCYLALGLRALHLHSWLLHFSAVMLHSSHSHSRTLCSLGLCGLHSHSRLLLSLKLCASHSHSQSKTHTHQHTHKHTVMKIRPSTISWRCKKFEEEKFV